MWGATEQNKPGLLLSSGQEMEHDDVCSQGNWTNARSEAHHWVSQLSLMTGTGVTSNNRHILPSDVALDMRHMSLTNINFVNLFAFDSLS